MSVIVLGSFQSKKVESTSGKDNPPIMTKSSSSVSKSGKNAYLGLIVCMYMYFSCVCTYVCMYIRWYLLGSALDSDIKSLGAVEVDDVSISSSHSSRYVFIHICFIKKLWLTVHVWM